MVAALAVAAFGACSTPEVAPVDSIGPRAASGSERDDSEVQGNSQEPKRPRKVDPKKGGFEIGLGEWALAPEADAIRPGTVTFVIHNRGTVNHGFEIALEGDSSGPGSGDLFKAESELLEPGESTRMTVDLVPGVYEIECLVDGHDDMGMEDVLEVSPSAPLVKVRPDAGPPDGVTIQDFAFSPSEVTVSAGTKVTWRNLDPAEHTVTAVEGDFGSDPLTEGDAFAHLFDRLGTYIYRCAIHPEMKGKVRVQ